MLKMTRFRQTTIIGLVAILILLIILPPLIFPFHAINLQDLKWTKASALLAVYDIQRDGKPGLLFLRLKDGKEQFIIGNWQVDYSDIGNAFVYGEPIIGEPDKVGQQIYVIENAAQLFHLQLLKAKNPIVSIQENPAQTYLAIETRSDHSSAYCIIEKISNKPQSCAQLNVQGTITQGRWNPKKERELVLKTETEEIYVRDAWDIKVKHIEASTDPALYQELTALFNPVDKEHTLIAFEGTYSFKRWLNFILIRHEKGWQLQRIPIFSKIDWLVDSRHLLVKTRNQLAILELTTGNLAPLLQEPGLGEKMIEFRNGSVDQTL